MNLKPLDDRIVVRRTRLSRPPSAGWSFPTPPRRSPSRRGPGGSPRRRSEQTGEIIPLDVKVGDTVVYSKYGGTEITVGGEDVLISPAATSTRSWASSPCPRC